MPRARHTEGRKQKTARETLARADCEQGGCTCCGYTGKHPALSEFHRFLGGPVLLEDQHRTGPLCGFRAARVVAGPIAHQHAVVVGRVDLRQEKC